MPDPITQSFPLFVGLYTWWRHGWLWALGAAALYVIIVCAFNLTYMAIAKFERDWVKDFQRFKWATMLLMTMVIGVL